MRSIRIRIPVSGEAARWGIVLGVALSLGSLPPAAAQVRPTLAIMPAQYFSADPSSAQNLTQGLIQQFGPQGYRVMPIQRSRSTFQAMGLQPNRHYPDRVALRFGRRMGADLVAYPRLLVLGTPATAPSGSAVAPAAVVHLRVLNARTGRPVFFRQIAHEFQTPRMGGQGFTLPQGVATAAAAEVTQRYFARVAGSRQEFRGRR